MRRCTEPLDLLKHVPDATEHGDGTVEVFEQMLEVDNDVIDRSPSCCSSRCCTDQRPTR